MFVPIVLSVSPICQYLMFFNIKQNLSDRIFWKYIIEKVQHLYACDYMPIITVYSYGSEISGLFDKNVLI